MSLSVAVALSAPGQKLKEIVEKNGEAILQDPDRCEGLLRDHCGAHRREISAIVGALNERVPLELKSSWQTAMTPEAMRARLIQRLEENRGLAPEIAGWAVDAWSYALGVGLERSSDRVEAFAGNGHGPTTASGPGAGRAHGDIVVVDGQMDGQIAGGAAQGAHGLARLQASFAGIKKPRNSRIAALIAVAVVVGLFAALRHPQPPPKPGPAPAPSQGPASPGSNQPRQPAANGESAAGGQAPQSGSHSGSQPGSQSRSQSGSTPGLRSSAAGGAAGGAAAGSANGSGSAASARSLALPAGAAIAVRIDQGVSSADAEVGETLPATVIAPLTLNGSVVLPRGANAVVRIAEVDRSGKYAGRSRLVLELARLEAEGGMVAVSTAPRSFLGPAQAGHTAERTGIGAGAGALVGFLGGRLLHHGGAGAGAGAAAGGVVGATTGKALPAKIAAETVMQFRLSRPAQLHE